jgi:predicted ATPase
MDLVGRDSELAEVLERLSRKRLVTITGPGGIGKTALAREALGRSGSSRLMVDLTRIDDPRGVDDAIAGQLGFQDLDALVECWVLTDGVCLVDNCEHVLDAAASAINRLLERIPDLSVLATSRTPLDLPGESLVALGPLDGDDPDRPDSMSVLLAAVADAGVDPARIDLEVAARICRLVDGVPLALEIAAARLRTMAPEELAESLGSDLGALTRPRFRGRSSHQGVAQMVAGSVALLADDLATAFDSLGVFAGPFTVEAAAAVVQRSDDWVRVMLDELVSASLVIADTSTGRARFRMLHPVRAVATDRLRRSGHLDDVNDRLVDHVVASALTTVQRAHAGWDGEVLGDLLASYEQIASSVRWSLDHDADPTRAFVLLTVLWGVIHQVHAAEVEALGSRALERWPEPNTPGRADVVSTVVTSRVILGGQDVEGLALATLAAIDGRALAASTLRRALAQWYRGRGRADAARELFREAAEVAEDLGAGGLAMESWIAFGMLVAELGDVQGGLDAIDGALERANQQGARLNASWAQTCRAAVLLCRSAAEALPAAESALESARALAYPVGTAASLRVLAMIHLAEGRLPEAASALLEMIEGLRRRGGLTDLRMALDQVAVIAEMMGEPDWDDLAVTAMNLPITTMFSLGDPALAERAASSGRVLSLREAHAVAHRILTTVASGEEPRADSGGGPTLRDLGDSWAIRFGESEITVRASKGMTDLSRLLAAPGVDIPAIDLMGASVTVEGSDEILDESARKSYQARIHELQSDIDEADGFGDVARAERARLELDAIVEQLTAATGLGGRRRRTPTAADRARSAVTHRLRSTIERIGSLDPVLGRHLETSITTGTFCAYRPDPPVDWQLVTPKRRTESLLGGAL